MTTDEILFGVGLLVALAVGSQILATVLRIPALIVLLPVGFTAGALTGDINPYRLLGPAFGPLVSLAVALILYDAGLGLDLRRLTGHPRRVVNRLVTVGAALTWAVAGFFASLLLGMSAEAAVMLGAILVVSGPTVVAPLLDFVRPTERLRQVLYWEGSMVDPIGLDHLRPPAVRRNAGPADPGPAVHLHLGDGHPAVPAAPGPTHHGSGRRPGAHRQAARRDRLHAGHRPVHAGAGVHRVDGAARDRGRLHRLHLLRHPGRTGHRWRVPSCRRRSWSL